MALCPCGSEKDYSDCCEPFITGAALPPTAEALMRSRYTAYVKEAIDYLRDTLTEEQRSDFSEDETRKWAKSSEWLGLEVVKTEGGGDDESEGLVQFGAKFRVEGKEHVHHEIGKFVKVDGCWFYNGFVEPEGRTVRREAPKVGRNDPCPCGSGKKYKKCCGA